MEDQILLLKLIIMEDPKRISFVPTEGGNPASL
jgi:hypothetical protein